MSGGEFGQRHDGRTGARPGQFSRRALVGVSAVGVSVLLSGCVPLGGTIDAEPEPIPPWLTVVATTPVLGDIVRSVAGSRVDVRTMMPPSADPRRFVPGPAAGDVFVEADLIVRHGMGLEPGLEGLLAAARDIPIVIATEAIPAESIITTPAGTPDPYIWHDPTLLPFVVTRILRALHNRDDNRRHGAAWDTNSVTYLNQIAVADAYLRRRLDRVPVERRILATANATYGYLGRRYGFETVALLNDAIPFATEVDADRFANALIARKPTVVFPDASVPVMPVQAAILWAGATIPIIPIAGLLYGSGLGLGNTYEGHYLGMIRRNADRIVAALA